jgi:hypothetical protein
MYVVDVYEAWPQSTERAQRGLAGFEALPARTFNCSPRPAGLPAEIVAAVARTSKPPSPRSRPAQSVGAGQR